MHGPKLGSIHSYLTSSLMTGDYIPDQFTQEERLHSLSGFSQLSPDLRHHCRSVHEKLHSQSRPEASFFTSSLKTKGYILNQFRDLLIVYSVHSRQDAIKAKDACIPKSVHPRFIPHTSSLWTKSYMYSQPVQLRRETTFYVRPQ